MKYALALAVLLCAAPLYADEVVILNFSETTVLDGTAIGTPTGIPLTFETPNEILSIAIDWIGTGEEPPFPTVYGFEGNFLMQGINVDPFCEYLNQSGPGSFYATDCVNLNTPYVAAVTYAGPWGSATLGFGGNEPIDIESSFTQRTVAPEPSSLALLGLGLSSLLLRRVLQPS